MLALFIICAAASGCGNADESTSTADKNANKTSESSISIQNDDSDLSSKAEPLAYTSKITTTPKATTTTTNITTTKTTTETTINKGIATTSKTTKATTADNNPETQNNISNNASNDNNYDCNYNNDNNYNNYTYEEEYIFKAPDTQTRAPEITTTKKKTDPPKTTTTKKKTETSKQATQKPKTDSQSNGWDYCMTEDEIISYYQNFINSHFYWENDMTIQNSGWNCPKEIFPGESLSQVKEGIEAVAKTTTFLLDYEGCPDGDIAYKIVVREVSEEEDPWQGRHLIVFFLE